MEKLWNIQKEKDVFFEIKGWRIYYFECIMTDGTTQYAKGFRDECADGQVNTYFYFTDKDLSIDEDLELKYDTDDILCWREIEDTTLPQK